MQQPSKHPLSHMILACLLLLAGNIFSQTNPTPQTLPYSQDFSTLAAASTTYPTGVQGWKISSGATTTVVTSAPTGDQVLIGSSSASNNSGGCHNYNGKIGILSSGSTNPAIALAIETTGKSNVIVTYDIMVIRNPYDGTTNTRINTATLQYRIGTTGTFTTLAGIDYSNGTTLQTGSGVTTPQNPQTKTITLPATCNNQSVVQIRWMMYDGTGVGSRPSFAVDNISVKYDNDGDGYAFDVDCNDANALIHPGAPENCNLIDDDCDGFIDEGTLATFYADADGDIYGNPGVTSLACTAPLGYVGNSLDCNDADPAVNPGATEICNTIDDNCNGFTDDSDPTIVGQPTWFEDIDGDTYGNGAISLLACNMPVGYTSDPSDCDDTNPAVNLAATEICNGFDDNCDGLSDDDDPGITGQPTWYFDADGDSYGDADITTIACIAPSGYVASSTDCNDANISIHPFAPEVCNGMDDNCNGLTDDGLTFTTYYFDADGDGYGNTDATVSSCLGAPPVGYVSNSTDCNDINISIHPFAPEVCNGVDDNCNGLTDDGLTFTTYYFDNDGDGFGDAAINVSSCLGTPPVGYVSNADDCNDASFTYDDADGDGFGAGAVVACGAVTNNADCSPSDITYNDADGDGYGADTPVACGTSLVNTDCDDAEPSAHPGGTEICDGFDNDCDGEFDEGTVTAIISPSGTVSACKGSPLILTANGGEGYSYQWFKNGNVLVGATDIFYAANKPGYYQVQVNVPAGCFALSDITTVNVNPAPNANISAPNGTSLCTTVKLKASYDPTYTWQWKNGPAVVPGATAYLFYPTSAGSYTCVITNALGCTRATAAVVVTACKEGAITENAPAEIFDLYPNPAENAFTVEMEINSDATDATIQLINMVGENIYSASTPVGNGTINAHIELNNNIPSGLYIVKVTVAEKEYTKQLIIQK